MNAFRQLDRDRNESRILIAESMVQLAVRHIRYRLRDIGLKAGRVRIRQNGLVASLRYRNEHQGITEPYRVADDHDGVALVVLHDLRSGACRHQKACCHYANL